jgi:hypothetical protein
VVEVALVFRMIRLSCGLRFARGSECTDLSDRLFVLFSKAKIHLLQPLIPLAALVVVGLFYQSGALCSLSSEAYGGPHRSASESSLNALQHFLSRNAITLIPPYTIEFLISETASGARQTFESAGSADISPQTASYGGTKRQILTTREVGGVGCCGRAGRDVGRHSMT